MDKMIKEIDYIYTLQEITDIVDKLFSPDDYILDESGRYILGIRNIEESRKRNYITELLLKLRDINKKIKNGDFNIGYRYTYEEIQNMKDDRQKIYNTLCKELNISVKEKETKTIPNELKTDIAKKWLTKAIENGFLNYDYLTTDKLKTKAQKALFAECFSEKIGLKYKYVYFETLWGVSGLSKIRYKSKEEVGKVKGGEPIEEFFKQD